MKKSFTLHKSKITSAEQMEPMETEAEIRMRTAHVDQELEKYQRTQFMNERLTQQMRKQVLNWSN